MIAIIQCAASKQSKAGRLATLDGMPVRFVADPDIAPPDESVVYKRPDAPAYDGMSWREVLLDYVKTKPDNPLRLLPAWQLYDNPIYARLVGKFGPEKVYILSAGWGLITSIFLTPDYDITFSQSADRYARRGPKDLYRDFCFLPSDTTDDIFFFGGKDYLPLFAALTSSIRATKTVFFNSKKTPKMLGYELRRFDTTTRTNWQYECANAFLDGALQAHR